MAKVPNKTLDDLNEIIRSAIDSVIPSDNLKSYLPEPPKGRVIVVGAGKASAAMAAAIDKKWQKVDLTGVVSTRYDHGVDAGRIRIIEAGHPVPDESSEFAANEMLNAVKDLTENDLVLALVSGGGSATCALPIDGLSLEQKQSVTKTLLRSGASITEINCVRKSLSKIKGGGLAAVAYPGAVHSLIISDIPGDDPRDVASGPTVICENQTEKARAILKRYNVDDSIIKLLANKPIAEVNASQSISHELVATPIKALQCAADKASKLGYTPLILSDEIEGESAELGKILAAIAKSVAKHGVPIAKPAAIITGGETTVTIGDKKPGKGGRNTEFMLSFVIETEGAQGIYAAAADSDGIDGTEDAAGAVMEPNTLSRAKSLGLNAIDYLENHDSYSFFEGLDDLIITGPTLTNVNDIRVILIK